MGTRADYYIGRGPGAEWIGSTAWDSYPDGMPAAILDATDEATFRAAVEAFFSERRDVTRPEQGWPWPWNDSATTDYAYAFDGGGVFYSIGYPAPVWWLHANGAQPDDDDPRLLECERCVFPDMSMRKNVRFDHGSGLIIVQG